ncbi:sugar phosphate nucleotidyltransferase [Paenibacillus sp. NFR01]|uniref:sugar phosphate nucleotidyltransferase n=1 Tax=Paenibacillus sp. NFR01 TaxID=1566279 RepID=UPI0008C89FC9|nr:sugar phosphate nucleotidyltransferase [Paenibacillus sp. NFR01]SEU14266.1 CBS domain-containing protein [Paenibacillus sp. NFR01]
MDFSKLLVTESTPILKVMQIFNATGKQLALIAPEGKLEAVVTDGDIRRHIVSGGSLETAVGNIANYNPKFVWEHDKESAKKIMQQYSINILPVLNDKGIVTSLIFSNDVEIDLQKKIELPVVIMAGGLGTRLYPYTKILPKPLIPIGDYPIIEHIINRFTKVGCEHFHLIVNHKKNMIKSYFSELNHNYNVHFVDEDEPLGTGGGLSLLKGKMDQAFFLSNCDILVDADYESIYRQHKEQNNVITMVCAFKHVTIPYGVIDLDASGSIKAMVEKPEYSFLTNTGMYLVEPRVIEEMENGKAMGFPDIIEHYRNAGENVGVYPVNEKCWLDMGQLEELEEMRKSLGV